MTNEKLTTSISNYLESLHWESWMKGVNWEWASLASHTRLKGVACDISKVMGVACTGTVTQLQIPHN